jgi:N utilization substance protein A
MAKKEETINLVDTFSEFKELKNIDRTTLVSVLEESFRSVIAKTFGTDENYDVIVNPDKGDFEIWRNREVVADEDFENPHKQISLTEARKIDASYEVGEEVTDEFDFANLDVVPSLTCARLWQQRSWIWRRIAFATNILTRWAQW